MSLHDLILRANEIGREMSDLLENDSVESDAHAMMLIKSLHIGITGQEVNYIQIIRTDDGKSRVIIGTDEELITEEPEQDQQGNQ